MNTIHYYPKASEKNAQTSPCPNCHFLVPVDSDDDGETVGVFYNCNCTGVPEEQKMAFCEANRRLNALKVEIENAEQEVASALLTIADAQECDDGDDGQPDEAKEWEDFGECYSDGDDS